jgi:hypothetical protein
MNQLDSVSQPLVHPVQLLRCHTHPRRFFGRFEGLHQDRRYGFLLRGLYDLLLQEAHSALCRELRGGTEGFDTLNHAVDTCGVLARYLRLLHLLLLLLLLLN